MSNPMIPNARPRIVPNLEDDIKALAQQRTVTPPNVTAEMALQQYEATANAVSMLREVIREQVEQQSASLADLHATMKLVEDAANQIRDRGQAAYEQIEKARAVAEEIRHLVAECMKKVGA